MSTIQDLFQQAQLSEAAYANFAAHPGDPKAALQDQANNMSFSTTTQATEFLKHWCVVDQSPPLGFFGNGFSATLFERLDANQQPTGQYTLSIAGSISLTDFANDVDLATGGVAYFQVESMVNYVLRLQAGSAGITRQVELLSGATAPSLTSTLVSGAAPGIAPNQLTVTGHSLGGFLGQVYQRIFGSAGVYTYNALGVVRPEAPIFSQLTSLLGLPPGNFGSGLGENLLVPGDPAQFIGTVQGKPQIQIFSETANQGPFDAHSIVAVTDALALYDLFARLDPTLGLSEIGELLQAVSNQAADTLEAALAALGKVFGKTYPATETSRDTLYTNLYDLQAATAGVLGLTIRSLTDFSAGQLALVAQDNLAYRYALKELNPFAVLGADYSAHNANGELERYDPATGDGNLSDRYLQDRAEMLAWKMQFDTEDRSYGAEFNTLTIAGDWDFIDRATLIDGQPLKLAIDGVSFGAPTHQIVFGGDQDESGADALTGGDHTDRLYGGAGADTLTGGPGNDYLAGGDGEDSYRYTSGDGVDTVLDSDGLGTIQYDGVTLSGGAQALGDLWRSADGRNCGRAA